MGFLKQFKTIVLQSLWTQLQNMCEEYYNVKNTMHKQQAQHLMQ